MPHTETDSAARLHELECVFDALLDSFAIIEFSPDGSILTANDKFLTLLGYAKQDVVGKHHRLFCDPAYASSPAYADFWRRLAAGESITDEFPRRNKQGASIWVQATYKPVLDEQGKVAKVIKVATDTTERRLKSAADEGKVAAISRSQAVIEFELDGTVVTANDNFLNTLGYELDEVVGEHHRIFCEPKFAASNEYKAFWRALRGGQFLSGEYKRIAKDGQEVWIQASYNPIFDASGKPCRVVKFATDITASKQKNAEYEGKVQAISRSQAVIEFNLDGTILTANENFLNAVGYGLSEIVGQHHRMFCEPQLVASAEYAQFWESLRNGKFQSGEFKRVAKGGKEVWIQASYNPILDADGRPCRVVKFASDITAQHHQRRETMAREERERQWLEDQIQRILKTVSAAGQGDLSSQIETDADGAVGSLAAGINQMVRSLREVMAREEKQRSQLQEQIEKVLRTVSAAGQGDLTNRIEINADGAIGSLAEGVNQMIVDLRDVVSKVVASARAFAEQSGSMANSARDMATRTENLGATSEEMSANVEELTASISSIAKSSREANALAKEASTDAENGTAAVRESLEAMERINHSASEIGEIVKVISEIASQTNLLAFNAAIEAARAGQHGRGFAVVADEVRKLAERSSSATKEISKLITESTSRIQKGSQVSEHAAQSFRQIATRVESTYAAINQIATGAEEQSTAAREVNSGVQAVSSEAEKSAHSCDSIARTCSELSEQARQLQELVQRFRV